MVDCKVVDDGLGLVSEVDGTCFKKRCAWVTPNTGMIFWLLYSNKVLHFLIYIYIIYM